MVAVSLLRFIIIYSGWIFTFGLPFLALLDDCTVCSKIEGGLDFEHWTGLRCAVHGFIGIKLRLPTDSPAARDGWRRLEMWGQVDALLKIAPCLAFGGLCKKKGTSRGNVTFWPSS